MQDVVYTSAGAEEYLEAIYQFGERGEEATTSRLAEWLEVAAPSVSEMMRRLGEQELVEYQPYRPIRLTPAGCIRASRLLRRQRLWEVLLFEHLHVPWHLVFAEACSLEHSTSALTESHLVAFLGHPSFCPHGYPIPEVGTCVLALAGAPLTTLERGQSCTVRRIPERHSNILRVLESHGITPGVDLVVTDKGSPDHPVEVRIHDRLLQLPPHLAQIIIVDPVQA